MRTELLSAIVCLLVVPLASAEVVESSANSLRVRHVRTVQASPEKVWNSFLRVSGWWNSDHTYSGSAANLRIEPHAGGCFCETLPNGSVQHMTVVFVSANDRMTLSGALGPMQTAGVAGALTFQIAPGGEGSEMTLTYNVGGYYPGGLSSIATVVDGMLSEQCTRLQRFIETGMPEEKKAAK